MENPATWGEAELIISEVLDDHDRVQRGPEPLCGFSVEKLIADALRKAGLLKEEVRDVEAEDPAEKKAKPTFDTTGGDAASQGH